MRLRHAGRVGSGDPSDPLDLVRLPPLMNRSTGISEIIVGLVDGPVMSEHAGLSAENLQEVSGKQTGSCSDVTSVACVHGTFVAGVLCAKRDSGAPAICPG